MRYIVLLSAVGCPPLFILLYRGAAGPGANSMANENSAGQASSCQPLCCHTLQAVHACASLGTEEQLVLPGYGVEAVLKNMEYSAMDDKSKADAAAAAAAKKKLAGNSGDALAGVDVSDLGEVKGFKFDVLVRRKPQLVQELMTFRDVLQSSDEEEGIKVRCGNGGWGGSSSKVWYGCAATVKQ
eukprot:GHRQ01010065.1.p2 GENE.GHRQ01010065.1~~GHRQ01010065.1.p2  ORF type:complete len:184 (-),score=51.07 GHRQ01010065.1:589-1140(-)